MGVVELPRLVREMLLAVPGVLRALIHAPESLEEGFDELGCVVPGFWSTASIPIPEKAIRVVQGPSEQADAMVGVLRAFGGAFQAEEVVVGVPDPELVPFLQRGLSSAQVPNRFAGGTPVVDSGPFRLLMTLAEYLEGRSFDAFATLIRHPDLYDILKGLEGSEAPTEGAAGEDVGADVTGPLATVDRYQTRHLQASVEGPLPGGDKVAREMRGLVQGLEERLHLEVFSGCRPLSEWMGEVLEILVKVYGSETLDLGKRGARHTLEVLTRVKGAAERLATLPRPLRLEMVGADAIRLLLADLQVESIPPDPQEHAVELLGWLELPLDDAPAVVLTGANDRFLPESLGPDPLLPGSLRSHLGMADDEARYARDAYLLGALIRSRQEVHLVSGRSSVAGDPLRPSRLLFAEGSETVARRISSFLGEEEGREDAHGGSPAFGESAGKRKGESVSDFSSPPVDPLPPLGSLSRMRVTDFAAFLKDPYRFALTRVLHLEPLQDEDREMTGMIFGSLAHLVLERFGRSEEVSSPDPRLLSRKLDRILDGAVHEEFGHRPLPAVRVQVEQLRARLHRLALWHAEWVEEGWRVEAVEAQPGDGVVFHVDGEPVLLRGKIDRIDHNPRTGEWAVLDYKTGDGGESPEQTHGRGRGESRRWVDLQLPLYHLLLPGILREDGSTVVPQGEAEKVKLGYLLLPKRLDEVGPSFADWGEDLLAEAVEEARDVIRTLRKDPFRFDASIRGFRGDPFDPLLGRMELPRAPAGSGGEE